MTEGPSENEALRSEFADDPEMVELVELFVGEMPDRISTLEQCLQQQRLDELHRVAHQMKGAASGYGFPSISSAAKQVENSLKEGAELDRIQNEVDELIDLCKRITV